MADKAAPLFSGLALIFILLTYGGWNEAAYLTAEMRDAKRGIVRALIIGILIITALYLLLNFAYLNALGLAGDAGFEGGRNRLDEGRRGAMPARWCSARRW